MKRTRVARRASLLPRRNKCDAVTVTPGETMSASSMSIDEDDRHELDYIRIEGAGIAYQTSKLKH